LDNKKFPWFFAMGALTVFQLLSFAPILLTKGQDARLVLSFLCYIPAEWLFLLCLSALAKRKNLAIECVGLWLSGISLMVCGSLSSEYAWKQAIAIGIGLFVYAILTWIVAEPDRAMFLRPFIAVGAGGLLALNLALAKITNDTLNWIEVGGFSLQPSELVKIAFIFVGAATLDRLQRSKSITRYLIFAMTCVAALFLMRDFGTALIFFATFLLIAILRAGDIRAIALAIGGALMGAAMVLLFKPYVLERFRSFRHVWEDTAGKGYQQSRVLTYASSGGWFGLGIGNGKLRNVFAATTDLVFGLLCEECGMIIAFLVPISYIVFAVAALRRAKESRSTFYAIASVSACGLILIQASLNIFGITDLLPLTGVTLPFISRGGSSMLCSWGLLALVSCETNGWAAVRVRPARQKRRKKTRSQA
jgi:cell division protein FtsW (lipid II flippase)